MVSREGHGIGFSGHGCKPRRRRNFRRPAGLTASTSRDFQESQMKLATGLLPAAAVVSLTATAFAQVTPGGPGERKANQSPSMTATESPAGKQPGTQPDFAKGPKSTSGAAVQPGDAGWRLGRGHR